jgi:hypothetical protein
MCDVIPTDIEKVKDVLMDDEGNPQRVTILRGSTYGKQGLEGKKWLAKNGHAHVPSCVCLATF